MGWILDLLDSAAPNPGLVKVYIPLTGFEDRVQSVWQYDVNNARRCAVWLV